MNWKFWLINPWWHLLPFLTQVIFVTPMTSPKTSLGSTKNFKKTCKFSSWNSLKYSWQNYFLNLRWKINIIYHPYLQSQKLTGCHTLRLIYIFYKFRLILLKLWLKFCFLNTINYVIFRSFYSIKLELLFQYCTKIYIHCIN